MSVVALVDHGKPAEKIGLQPGDTILTINGAAVNFGSLQEMIRSNAGKEIVITWAHGNQQMHARVTPTAERTHRHRT